MGGVGESGDAGLVEVRPRISTDATAYGGLLERNCGLEGEEPQRAALRSFGSCDAVWRGGHLWSVFGMLGENLLSSTRGWAGLVGRGASQAGQVNLVAFALVDEPMDAVGMQPEGGCLVKQRRS